MVIREQGQVPVPQVFVQTDNSSCKMRDLNFRIIFFFLVFVIILKRKTQKNHNKVGWLAKIDQKLVFPS